jgi:hypothetical protein
MFEAKFQTFDVKTDPSNQGDDMRRRILSKRQSFWESSLFAVLALSVMAWLIGSRLGYPDQRGIFLTFGCIAGILLGFMCFVIREVHRHNYSGIVNLIVLLLASGPFLLWLGTFFMPRHLSAALGFGCLAGELIGIELCWATKALLFD